MVKVEEITKNEFLTRYIDGYIVDVVGPLDINGEIRLYGRNFLGAGEEEVGYIAVYCVV